MGRSREDLLGRNVWELYADAIGSEFDVAYHRAMDEGVAVTFPVPAIVLTGYGRDEDVRRSREAGFSTHMTKPIDFTKLEAMIRRVTR